MNLEAYKSILSEPWAFWVANCNKELKPEMVRVSGIAPVTGIEHITVYVADVYAQKFLQNTQENKNITLLGTCVPTYESYQFKGLLTALRPCTPDEEVMQQRYFDAFTDVVQAIGYSKEGFYGSFFHVPSHAVSFRVLEIFEQTPRKGTGSRISNLEESAQEAS